MMNVTEARGVVGVLIAYYPTKRFERESVEAWAAGLAEFEVVDALAAANELGRTSKFLPSLAELIGATNLARIRRLDEQGTRRLPEPAGGPWITFETWLADYATEAERVIVRRVFPALAAKYGIEAIDA